MSCNHIDRITIECYCDYVTALRVRHRLAAESASSWRLNTTQTQIHFHLPHISNRTVTSLTGENVATRAGGTKFDAYGYLRISLDDCGGVYLVFEALKKAGYVS